MLVVTGQPVRRMLRPGSARDQLDNLFKCHFGSPPYTDGPYLNRSPPGPEGHHGQRSGLHVGAIVKRLDATSPLLTKSTRQEVQGTLATLPQRLCSMRYCHRN